MFTLGRWGWFAGLAFAASVSCGLGCSNLSVHKVPVSERIAGDDKQQGFRYYLNRPYLVVKQPILVAETRSLVAEDPDKAAPTAPGKADSEKSPETGTNALRITFLSGPRCGKSAQLADLRVETPASNQLQSMTQGELEKMGEVLAAGGRKAAPPAPVNVPTLPPSPPIIPSNDGVAVTGPGGVVSAAGEIAPILTSSAALSGTAGGPGAPAAAVASSAALTADDMTALPTPTAPQDAAALQGKIDLIYLPDLDEQYVIKSCNVMAKSRFGLAFRNGCELTEVEGDHDATTLAVNILQLLQSAIGTAQGVEQSRIQQQARILQAAPKTTGGLTNMTEAKVERQQPIWILIERTWIKPGVYRLNKPWEVANGSDVEPTGCGLLAKLGLPTVVDVDLLPTTDSIHLPKKQ